MIRRPPRSTLFPTRRSSDLYPENTPMSNLLVTILDKAGVRVDKFGDSTGTLQNGEDRKSTRLNSSHANISYAVFCLKKKKKMSSQNPQHTPGTHTSPPTRCH